MVLMKTASCQRTRVPQPKRPIVSRRLHSGWAMLVVGCGLSLWVGTASGQTNSNSDRIVLQRPNSSGQVALTGTIQDYTSEWLYFQQSSRSETTRYPSAEVVSITTVRTADHERALVAVREKRFDEAVSAGETALSQEKRVWVRRELLALIVQAASAQGQLVTAGEYFRKLAASHDQSRFTHRVPLLWSPRPIDQTTRQQAIAWLGTDEAWARLMGASVLLDDPQETASAQATLESLKSSTHREISLLAEAQLWRLVLQQTVPNDFAVRDWQRRIESWEPRFRAGPKYLLGKAHTLRYEHDEAAFTLLWIPLVGNDNELLAARALLEGADALRHAGQLKASQRLYRELTIRYAHTEFAADASAELIELESRTQR